MALCCGRVFDGDVVVVDDAHVAGVGVDHEVAAAQVLIVVARLMQHVERRRQAQHGVHRGLHILEAHPARLGRAQEPGHELVGIIDIFHHIALDGVALDHLLRPNVGGRFRRLGQLGAHELHHIREKSEVFRLVRLQAFPAVGPLDQIGPALPALGKLLDDAVGAVLRRLESRARHQCLQVAVVHNRSFTLSNDVSGICPDALPSGRQGPRGARSLKMELPCFNSSIISKHHVPFKP